MRIHFLFLSLALSLCAVSCNDDPQQKLNLQAAQEYLVPVRPGSADGSVPFWNEYAGKFIYAPSFDFKKMEGAVSYKFTVTGDEASWSFTASEPTAALSPIWNDITVGQVKLSVEALDAAGQALGIVGEKEFLRDYPFKGPYHEKLYPYEECIRRGLVYVHTLPPVIYWETHDTPDMTYEYNSYLCKIIGNMLSLELMYGEAFPEEKESVMKRCRNIASFIMSQAQGEGAPLAYFPPTYYGDYRAAGESWNDGKTMTMEPVEVVEAFLDMYKACGEQQYLDFAKNIIRTYQKIRRPDGSFPVKLYYLSGEEVNDANGSPHPIILSLQRFEREFGITEFKDFRLSLEKWVADVLIPSFNWNGQFEDQPVEGIKPYENLTNCIAAPVALILMQKPDATQEELKQAEEMTRFCEDQFLYWDSPVINGIHKVNTPCVFEQYKWKEPTDASTADVMACFAQMYRHTGDRLWLAKANALAANITFLQNKVTGMIPTWGFINIPHMGDDAELFWINCTKITVGWLRMLMEISGEE